MMPIWMYIAIAVTSTKALKTFFGYVKFDAD